MWKVKMQSCQCMQNDWLVECMDWLGSSCGIQRNRGQVIWLLRIKSISHWLSSIGGVNKNNCLRVETVRCYCWCMWTLPQMWLRVGFTGRKDGVDHRDLWVCGTTICDGFGLFERKAPKGERVGSSSWIGVVSWYDCEGSIAENLRKALSFY